MKYIELFETYNKALEKASNDFFENINVKTMKYNDEDYKDFLLDRATIWAMVDVDGVGKPAEVIDNIKTVDEMIKSFIDAAMICDDELPEIYIQKMYEFLGELEDKFLDLIFDEVLLRDEEKFVIPNEAIKTIGRLRSKEVVKKLVEILYIKNIPEVIYESTKESLVNIGNDIVDVLIERIESSESIGHQEEYILMAIAEIGRAFENEKIFKCLKNAFKIMSNKVHGAMCLCDYGDTRAVTLLKTYLEKNRENLNKTDYNMIEGVIKNLGGSTEDL